MLEGVRRAAAVGRKEMKDSRGGRGIGGYASYCAGLRVG